MSDSRPVPPIGGIHESSLYVRDLAKAAAFYRRVFGFDEIARDATRHVFLRAGRDVLLLFNADTTTNPTGSVPPHGATGEIHLAFETTAEGLEAWRARLSALEVEIEAEVEWPRGGRSLYIRDPDGHSIELVTRGIWGF